MSDVQFVLDGTFTIPALVFIALTQALPITAGFIAMFSTDDRRVRRAMAVLKATTTSPFRRPTSPGRPKKSGKS